jgi:hypothetical protein
MRFSGRDSRAAERGALGADTMARNVEIKTKIEELAPLLERVKAVADSGPIEIDQDDTFFRCPSGRLKLRELSSSEGQLIFYERPDCAGPKESRYFICPTTQPRSLRETLTWALGMVGRVRKRRLLYLVRNTRWRGSVIFLNLKLFSLMANPSRLAKRSPTISCPRLASPRKL